MNKNKDYLITEKPSRALFAFALPMIIGNLFQQAYTIVDSAIVGHYVGETALAAVGASYALTSIFICVAIGGGIGASVIISQHFGGHAYSRMKTSIRTAMLSFLLISLDGFDMVTNFTAIAATLNNIGPGLAQVGPMMNFGSFTNPAKLVMIFDMLAGRLEIFPMLVLFVPDTWRRF